MLITQVEYHYYLPEYTVNNSSRELGEKNLFYVQQRLSLAPITSTAGSHRQSNLDNRLPLEPLAPPDPLQLDEPSRSPPVHWELPKPVPDVDSAYGTNEASERVQASSDNPYMDPSLLFQYPVQLGWNSPNGYVSSYPGPLELEMELTDGAPGPEISDGRSG
jgi:hypothetical protein